MYNNVLRLNIQINYFSKNANVQNNVNNICYCLQQRSGIHTLAGRVRQAGGWLGQAAQWPVIVTWWNKRKQDSVCPEQLGQILIPTRPGIQNTMHRWIKYKNKYVVIKNKNILRMKTSISEFIANSTYATVNCSLLFLYLNSLTNCS